MAIIFLNDCCNCGGPIFADKIDMSEKAKYSGTNWEADSNLCVECYMKVYGLSVEARKNEHEVPQGVGSSQLISYLGKRLAALDSEVKKLEAAMPRWIEVTPNTLPEELKSVYCNTPNGVCTGYIMNGRWFTPNGTIVTDWMEMPTPPTRNSI